MADTKLRLRVSALLLGVLLAAGCGGSNSARASSTKAITTTTRTTPTATASSTTQSQSTPTTQAPSATTVTAGTNVRLPARFTIRPGGSLSPSAVFAPAHVPIELIVISGDGRAHHVLLRTPTPRRLTVPAHGRAIKLIPALRAGTYPLLVDGRRRGALHVGAAPGP